MYTGSTHQIIQTLDGVQRRVLLHLYNGSRYLSATRAKIAEDVKISWIVADNAVGALVLACAVREEGSDRTVCISPYGCLLARELIQRKEESIYEDLNLLTTTQRKMLKVIHEREVKGEPFRYVQSIAAAISTSPEQIVPLLHDLCNMNVIDVSISNYVTTPFGKKLYEASQGPLPTKVCMPQEEAKPDVLSYNDGVESVARFFEQLDMDKTAIPIALVTRLIRQLKQNG